MNSEFVRRDMERERGLPGRVSFEPLSEDYSEKMCQSPIRIILRDIYLSSLFDALRAVAIVISASGIACHPNNKALSLERYTLTNNTPKYSIDGETNYDINSSEYISIKNIFGNVKEIHC